MHDYGETVLANQSFAESGPDLEYHADVTDTADSHGIFEGLDHLHLPYAPNQGALMDDGTLRSWSVLEVNTSATFADGASVGFIIAYDNTRQVQTAFLGSESVSGTSRGRIFTVSPAPIDHVRVIGVKSLDAFHAWADAHVDLLYPATVASRTSAGTSGGGSGTVGDGNGRG